MSRRKNSLVHSFALTCAALLLAGGCHRPASQRYVLQGDVVTPAGVIRHGRVSVENGRIMAVGQTVDVPNGVPIIDTGGVIFPGLVDLHNHLTWDAFPRWKPPQTTARYDWMAMPEYTLRLDAPHAAVELDRPCDLQRFGEIRALIGGATTAVGSFGPSAESSTRNECDKGLVRNLDTASGLYGDRLNHEPLRNRVFPLEMDKDDTEGIRHSLASHQPVLVHVAEGISPSAAREFTMLTKQGMLHPGLAIVHGVALRTAAFQAMAANHVGLVWSPRSNIALYGQTARVDEAKRAGIVIALGPDWSVSGSNGMLDELSYAAAWNANQRTPVFAPSDFVAMATINPAILAGADSQIGSIAVGKRADFLILNAGNGSAEDALTHSRPSDVRLVIVDGRSLYGRAELLTKVNPHARLERVEICGAAQAIDLSESDAGKGSSLHATRTALSEAFRRVQPQPNPPLEVAPLVECP